MKKLALFLFIGFTIYANPTNQKPCKQKDPEKREHPSFKIPTAAAKKIKKEDTNNQDSVEAYVEVILKEANQRRQDRLETHAQEI